VDYSDVFVLSGLVFLFIGLIFVFALLGTAIGAFVGWIISLTPLGGFVESGFEAFGVHASGLLAQIGALLGFISGFIRGTVEVKHEKKD